MGISHHGPAADSLEEKTDFHHPAHSAPRYQVSCPCLPSVEWGFNKGKTLGYVFSCILYLTVYSSLETPP